LDERGEEEKEKGEKQTAKGKFCNCNYIIYYEILIFESSCTASNVYLNVQLLITDNGSRGILRFLFVKPIKQQKLT
jgi:hypothetical protein